MSLSRKTSVFRPRSTNEANQDVTANSVEALPSDIFEQRLYAWKSTIKQLILYFQTIAEVEQQSARGYSKAFNSLQAPLKEGHHLLPVGGSGVQDVTVAVNNTSQQLFEHHTEFARCITDQIVGNLTRLKSEIKTRLLSTKKELIGHESNLGRERQTSAKIISEYDQACHTADGHPSTGGKLTPTDPWLVYNGLQKQLQKQITEENGFHKTMISTQKSLEIFEASIIETLKSTLESYYKWRTTYTTKLVEQINVANEAITTLTPNLEWDAFFVNNQPPLIDPESSETTIDAINYPNKENPLTIPKKYGVMERQGGMFKSAKRDHCFITPSGFLHGYSNADPTIGSPEFSIYLPSSVLRGYSEANLAFEVAEKGSGGLFHRAEHSYVFKFLTRDELANWWSAIKEFTKSTEETPFNGGSQVIVPGTATGVGGAESAEPVPQESRATSAVEPAVLAQSTQPPATQPAHQDVAVGAQESQQPISSALQQSQYPDAVPQQQQHQPPVAVQQQQQTPLYTNDQGIQQQPQHTGEQNIQQVQHPVNQEIPPYSAYPTHQQPIPSQAANLQSINPDVQQPLNYDSSQAIPNTSQTVPNNNANTLAGVPGQLPGQ